LVQEDEDMDQKPQLWNGEYYDSEPDDINPRHHDTNMDDQSVGNS